MKSQTFFLIFTLFSMLVSGLSLNTEIDSNSDRPYLLGKIDKSSLTSNNYNSWFTKNYNEYKVDIETTQKLEMSLKEFEILAFMGTWCGESKREVPKFYKILEAIKFPKKQLNVIAVSSKSNMYKQSPNHEEVGLNIHRVPTFIFYKNGKEVNRIVEEPVESFEKDILNITSTNNYTSNYQIVSKVDKILAKNGLEGLKKESNKIAETFKEKVSSMYELNTYARVLKSSKRIEEAIEVYKLNIKLFPENPKTHMSLMNFLETRNQHKEAAKVLGKAIELFPKNKSFIKKLKTY